MATKKSARKKKKQPPTRFRIVVTLFIIIVVLSVALAGALIYLRHRDTPITEPKLSSFTVSGIAVSGNTRYDDKAIVGESGLKLGQSVWSVNKAAAAKKIEATFPYVEKAVVKSPSFNTITIEITETRILGAMYGDGKWLIVGSNGKVLETMPLESDRPGRYFYLQGATPAQGAAIGSVAMDERSVRIVSTVLDAVEANKIEGIMGIDMRDKTRISLNWKNTLTIVLGNESNLAAEIKLLAGTLPQILEKNGGVLSGRLDISSYSDSNDNNDQIIYTPQDVLENR
ncbi:MAG: FtsQ-type POTRA domain-containing protein [Clostridia bacterium]|nr:FtsQ-type POTRA domain-containing protein [Clostridia bacterium]